MMKFLLVAQAPAPRRWAFSTAAIAGPVETGAFRVERGKLGRRAPPGLACHRRLDRHFLNLLTRDHLQADHFENGFQRAGIVRIDRDAAELDRIGHYGAAFRSLSPRLAGSL